MMRWGLGVLLAAGGAGVLFQSTFRASGTGAVDRTAMSKLRDTVSVRDFGAVGDGVTDDSAAFAAMVASGASQFIVNATTTNVYLVNTAFSLPSNSMLIGQNRPQLKTTVAGNHIAQSVSTSNVTVRGIRFKGLDSTTAPISTVGGFTSDDTGLLAIARATDVHVENCEFDTFANGLSIIASTRAWITGNVVTNWLKWGVLTSQTVDFAIDHNVIHGSSQAGGVIAYGISATGNSNGGVSQFRSSISFNHIYDVPSWDGIMSHDVDGIRIIGNDIRNVRNGVDLSSPVNTSVGKVVVADNYIEATTLDTWATVAALHGGIVLQGFDATHLLSNASITGNVITGFFNLAAGATGSGTPGGISCTWCDRPSITGNTVTGIGAVPGGSVGVIVANAGNGATVVGNTLQGDMLSGGVRFTNITADVVAVAGNAIQQTNTVHTGVAFTGSTVTNLALGLNPTNSASPFFQSTSTLGLAIAFNGGPVTFATLGTPANGTFVFCSDCVTAPTCAGSGTGALAMRRGAAWTCNGGGTSNRGTITLNTGSGTATVLSGANCVCTDTTANASVKCAVATTTLTATGTGSDVIAYQCF